jgi:hypothetical protein
MQKKKTKTKITEEPNQFRLFKHRFLNVSPYKLHLQQKHNQLKN